MDTGSKLYNEEFFDAPYLEKTRASASEIADAVFSLMKPASVVDVGCGVGLFLAEIANRGILDIAGFDGPWVKAGALQIPAEKFTPHDLQEPISAGRTFDLAICLEVAEHLPPRAADTLVASLTSLAPVVLFSAAIPRQGGVGHLNEQWPSFWKGLFAHHDFVAVDCLRKRVWSNARVLWWYAQNMILFVHTARLERDEILTAELRKAEGHPLDVVHPEAFLHYRTTRKPSPPTLRRVLYDGKVWAVSLFKGPR